MHVFVWELEKKIFLCFGFSCLNNYLKWNELTVRGVFCPRKKKLLSFFIISLLDQLSLLFIEKKLNGFILIFLQSSLILYIS